MLSLLSLIAAVLVVIIEYKLIVGAINEICEWSKFRKKCEADNERRHNELIAVLTKISEK